MIQREAGYLMNRTHSLVVFTLLSVTAWPAGAQSPLLFQKPALNKTEIVFSYAGDLWRVPRGGGQAIRLTTGAGIENECRLFAGWQDSGVLGRV